MTRFEEQGRYDAQRGITACPYGVPEQARLWAKGHDKMIAEGLGDRPRFALTCPRRQRPVEPGLF